MLQLWVPAMSGSGVDMAREANPRQGTDRLEWMVLEDGARPVPDGQAVGSVLRLRQ